MPTMVRKPEVLDILALVVGGGAFVAGALYGDGRDSRAAALDRDRRRRHPVLDFVGDGHNDPLWRAQADRVDVQGDPLLERNTTNDPRGRR